MELNELRTLIVALRELGVTEYVSPDGLQLKLGAIPNTAAPERIDPRAHLSEAGRAMADAMDRMGGGYSAAFEVR